MSAAGGVSALPLSEMYSWGPITIEGRTPPPGELFINADERIVGGDYFQAMQIPLRRGRFFTAQDTAANPRVALIDEFMAQEYWPNQDPVGKRIHTGGINDAATGRGSRSSAWWGGSSSTRWTPIRASRSIFRRPRRRCAR